MVITDNGADLQSKVATNGTVSLVVEHADEHYEVLTQLAYVETDFIEIVRYLDEHGFEIMDPSESPAEETDFGWRYWACHKEGRDFGFASIMQMATVTAIGLAAVLAPKVGLFMDLVAA